MAAGAYTIGLDFGTLSARAVLVELARGEEIASAVYEYPSGVIDTRLPGGGPDLPRDYALQDPRDYLRAIEAIVPAVMRQGRVSPEQVIGLAVDFTSCTMLPTDESGRPLAADPRFAAEPHAWAKLWKHHAAQPQADRITRIARERGESFLSRYGGKVSSEWFFPKALEILEEAPEVYAAAARLIEAGDWVTWQLTGVEVRNACAAGYKAFWEKGKGYPSPAFFEALHPRMGGIVLEKMQAPVVPPGTRVGTVTSEWARRLGLSPQTSVAAAIIDAHASVPAAKVVAPGALLMVMGTSTCHMAIAAEARPVEGVAGVVEDGIIPGYYGYEAGQPATGDTFAWFADAATPGAYEAEAKRRGISVLALFEEAARSLEPGASGLLALDWWNGNRSILNDAELGGVILGFHLGTRPEEVYLALLESTAYGSAMIVEAFEAGGVPVEALVACGGLAKRNRLLLQIVADVTGKRIRIARSEQASALGSAMLAAVAAGEERGGYATIQAAAEAMAHLDDEEIVPDPKRAAVYGRLFSEYKEVHDYFGRGGNDVLKRLRKIAQSAGTGRGAEPGR